jgi:hypothetical protein
LPLARTSFGVSRSAIHRVLRWTFASPSEE